MADNLSNEDVVLDKLEEMMTWNGFARSLVDQHLAKGRLSPNQWAAANAGAVYVKHGDQYQGKISGGKFHAGRDCLDDTPQAVVRAAQDPRGVAVQYGRDTGICACCGRTLTDPASIEVGIGPICAEKWGL